MKIFLQKTFNHHFKAMAALRLAALRFQSGRLKMQKYYNV